MHIPIDNDDWIVRFLRPCKFYPESARDLVIIIFNINIEFRHQPFANPFFTLPIGADQKILQIQSEAFRHLRRFNSIERDKYIQTKHSGRVPQS